MVYDFIVEYAQPFFFSHVFDFLSVLILLSLVSIFVAQSLFHSLVLMMIIYVLVYPIFIWFGFDFIGTAFVMVYVGAVSILFLFVIMTLDGKASLFLPNTFKNAFSTTPLRLLLVSVVTVPPVSFISYFCSDYPFYYDLLCDNTTPLTNFNVDCLGFLIYELYFIELIVFSFLLLVAMIGSVVFFSKSLRPDLA